eukprot:256725_1
MISIVLLALLSKYIHAAVTGDPCDFYPTTDTCTDPCTDSQFVESATSTGSICELHTCTRSTTDAGVAGRLTVDEFTSASSSVVDDVITFCGLSCTADEMIISTCACPVCPSPTPCTTTCDDGSSLSGFLNDASECITESSCPTTCTTTCDDGSSLSGFLNDASECSGFLNDASECVTASSCPTPCTTTCDDGSSLSGFLNDASECITASSCPTCSDTDPACCETTYYDSECGAQFYCATPVLVSEKSCITSMVNCPANGAVDSISLDDCCGYDMADCCKLTCPIGDSAITGTYDGDALLCVYRTDCDCTITCSDGSIIVGTWDADALECDYSQSSNIRGVCGECQGDCVQENCEPTTSYTCLDGTELVDEVDDTIASGCSINYDDCCIDSCTADDGSTYDGVFTEIECATTPCDPYTCECEPDCASDPACCGTIYYSSECDAEEDCDAPVLVSDTTCDPTVATCPDNGGVDTIPLDTCCGAEMDDCCVISCDDGSTISGSYVAASESASEPSCDYSATDNNGVCDTDPGCPDDVVVCTDGTELNSRDGDNDCDWICPDSGCDTEVCCVSDTDDDPMTECEAQNTCDDQGFDDCPSDPGAGCTDDVVVCRDDTELNSRDGDNDCDWICPDSGCDTEVCCVSDTAGDDPMTECEARNTCDDQEFDDCPSDFAAGCTDDTVVCDDGTELNSRDGDNDCDWICPDSGCDTEVCCVSDTAGDDPMTECEARNTCDDSGFGDCPDEYQDPCAQDSLTSFNGPGTGLVNRCNFCFCDDGQRIALKHSAQITLLHEKRKWQKS